MTKNIVKEMIIFLLLALAIILILGVLLYKYVPANKIIPEKVSYTTPENVKTELQTDENVDDSEVVVTYQIDSTDLSNYKKIQEYVPGKKNPFAVRECGKGEYCLENRRERSCRGENLCRLRNALHRFQARRNVRNCRNASA